MEQILHAYCLPNETITAITMLYKNTKAMVRSPDGNTDFFDSRWSLAWKYIGTIFVYILRWLRTSNINRSNKRKWKKKARSRRYPVEIMSGEDQADDLVLLADILAQAESLLHNCKRHSPLRECICFKQKGAISTLMGKPLK